MQFARSIRVQVTLAKILWRCACLLFYVAFGPMEMLEMVSLRVLARGTLEMVLFQMFIQILGLCFISFSLLPFLYFFRDSLLHFFYSLL